MHIRILGINFSIACLRNPLLRCYSGILRTDQTVNKEAELEERQWKRRPKHHAPVQGRRLIHKAKNPANKPVPSNLHYLCLTSRCLTPRLRLHGQLQPVYWRHQPHRSSRQHRTFNNFHQERQRNRSALDDIADLLDHPVKGHSSGPNRP